MNTLFFGSSSYCIPLVASLHKNTDLVGAVTRPDTTFGRNKDKKVSPVKSYAESNHIPCFDPLNNDELIRLIPLINKLRPDIFIVADYGMMIPPTVYNLPKFKTLNIHFGKLPRYRGASPLQWSIANGEKNIPVSIILMDEGLDTGAIFQEISYETNGHETTGELYPKLFKTAGEHISQIIQPIISGELKPSKQSDMNIGVTKRLTRDDGFIPWNLFISITNNKSRITNHDMSSLSPIVQSAFSFSPSRPFSLSLYNLYRALSPWPGVWTTIESTNQQINKSTNQLIGKRLKILKLSLTPKPYTLTPDIVQLEGKKPVTWKQFKEAYLSLNSF